MCVLGDNDPSDTLRRNFAGLVEICEGLLRVVDIIQSCGGSLNVLEAA